MKMPAIERVLKDRSLLLRLGGTLLAIVLIVVLVREGGWDEVLAALKSMPPTRIALAVVLVLMSRLFVCLRWYVLLRSGGVKIPLSRSIALTFTGLFSNNFLPTTIGGDVVRLAGAMQLGYDRAVCLASIAADRLLGAFGNLFILPFGLIPAMGVLGNGMGQSLALAGLWSRGVRFAGRTLQTFTIWLRQPIALLSALACTWGHAFCTITSMYIFITGLGFHVDFMLVAGLWSLAYFITLIPISINGYGLQELSLTFLFSHVAGLSTAAGLTIALLFRALYAGVSLIGAFYLPGILAAMNRDRAPQAIPSAEK
jgi:uncharacterized membrane protein YbhN (UPF0104 family)